VKPLKGAIDRIVKGSERMSQDESEEKGESLSRKVEKSGGGERGGGEGGGQKVVAGGGGGGLRKQSIRYLGNPSKGGKQRMKRRPSRFWTRKRKTREREIEPGRALRLETGNGTNIVKQR